MHRHLDCQTFYINRILIFLTERFKWHIFNDTTSWEILKQNCDLFVRSIATPDKYQKNMKQLLMNIVIVIIKQDEECSQVIMNWSKYFENGSSVLQSKQFTKLDYHLISTLENKVQGTLHKKKSKIPEKVEKKVYPTGGSAAGTFIEIERYKSSYLMRWKNCHWDELHWI